MCMAVHGSRYRSGQARTVLKSRRSRSAFLYTLPYLVVCMTLSHFLAWRVKKMYEARAFFCTGVTAAGEA